METTFDYLEIFQNTTKNQKVNVAKKKVFVCSVCGGSQEGLTRKGNRWPGLMREVTLSRTITCTIAGPENFCCDDYSKIHHRYFEEICPN